MTDRIALAKARFSTGLPNSVGYQHANSAASEPGAFKATVDTGLSEPVLLPLSGSATPRWGPTSAIPPFPAGGMQIVVPPQSAHSPIDVFVPNQSLAQFAPPYLRLGFANVGEETLPAVAARLRDALADWADMARRPAVR
jgi:hypothetical protein